MSLFLPFSHRPSLTIPDPASYTCPVGKYARVSGTLSTDARTGLTNGTSTGNNSNSNTTAGNIHFEFWVNVGDVVTKSTDNISSSIAPAGASSSVTASDTGYARILLNGTVVYEVQSAASYTDWIGAGTLKFLTVTGSSNARILIEEYDIA